MSLGIAGTGWVTPLGSGVQAVWERLLRGEEAEPETISPPFAGKNYPVFRVPNTALEKLPVHPRLRRVGAISRFAVAAGLEALENARSTRLRQGYGAAGNGKIDMQRMALILAVSNGGVTYTKRFYHEIIESGAQAASPLLFPETVFNAPASHLAAVLGITGASYTLVGDGAVGILAIKMAEDLMADEALDCCLVVGAEEADWVLCDAYHKWRLSKDKPPVETFQRPAKGAILSEGAGALLLGRKGRIWVDRICPGGTFSHQNGASELTGMILGNLATKETGAVIASANGTFIDTAEEEAARRTLPKTPIYSLKPALGESVGASGLWQVIAGVQALATAQLPPFLHGPELKVCPPSSTALEKRHLIVLSCGLSQQAAGLRLAAES